MSVQTITRVDATSPDAIRTLFSTAMSEMYRTEVPAYQTLVELVEEVNAALLAADPAERHRLEFRRWPCPHHGGAPRRHPPRHRG
ncbi:2-oxoadipate dioxygenase/decarboxylase family protein [Azospirillum melinis]|uniref:2-oxoadipate dioxygenase/decarboxylase family protein n=1 Tax=Azospirillum melinis TaxID=328839 RepID=UPI0037579DB1